MSVQNANTNGINYTRCPIITNARDEFIAYQTASFVVAPHNVNSFVNSCAPTDYELSQVYTKNQVVSSCCGNTFSRQRLANVNANRDNDYNNFINY